MNLFICVTQENLWDNVGEGKWDSRAGRKSWNALRDPQSPNPQKTQGGMVRRDRLEHLG